MRRSHSVSRNIRLLILLVVCILHRAQGSWGGGDWGKSRESQLAFEDFHSKNRSNRRSAGTADVCKQFLTSAKSFEDRAATARYFCVALLCLPPVHVQSVELIHVRCSEPFKYNRDDLLIAIPGQTERLSLVEASRPWRKGVNTFIALEKQVEEKDAPEGFLV